MTTHEMAPSQLGARPATASAPGRAGEALASARLAGALYLIIVALGIFAEVAVRSSLIVDGDAAATAANIRDSEWLFRAGFGADLIVFLCDVALAVVLFLLFRPVSRTLSLLAAAFRLTQTAIIGLNLLAMFGALVVLEDADYLGAFGAGETEALAALSLDIHAYGYTLGLTFFAVSTLIIGYLAIRSGVVPKALGGLLMLAGVGYLADSFAFFLVPGYDGSISPILLAPAVVGELWFAVWLLLRGRRLQALREER
ncbi:MAG TPA: DUF4386 domain-containing protein [Solirubrobacteraceae bacterium]|nr:DUF4386 domain-containing protein [Solirubrobacteraceae bacterium]